MSERREREKESERISLFPLLSLSLSPALIEHPSLYTKQAVQQHSLYMFYTTSACTSLNAPACTLQKFATARTNCPHKLSLSLSPSLPLSRSPSLSRSYGSFFFFFFFFGGGVQRIINTSNVSSRTQHSIPKATSGRSKFGTVSLGRSREEKKETKKKGEKKEKKRKKHR